MLLPAAESPPFAQVGAVADARAAPADLGRGFELLPSVADAGCLVDDFKGDDGRFEDVFLLFSCDLAGASPKASAVAISALTTAVEVNNAKVTKLLARNAKRNGQPTGRYCFQLPPVHFSSGGGY